MDRRRFFIQSTAALAAMAMPHELFAVQSASPYRDALVIDALTYDQPEMDARKAVEAGLTAVVLDISIYPRSFENATHELGRWSRAFRRPDSPLLRVLKADDLRQAKRQTKLGVILACQDASILGSPTTSVNDFNVENLHAFYELGLRVLQLAHNERTALADGFREKNDAGLSRLGVRVVDAMNQLGMLVDLSHCGDRSTLDGIRISKKPCAITHAGCRALHPSLRNKTDEQIRAVAERGGFFGVFHMTLWLTQEKKAGIDDVVRHIEHAVRVAGIDHVGFGSDGPVLQLNIEEELKGMQGYAKRNLGEPGAESIPVHVRVPELNSPARLEHLADALARRGFGSSDIEKLIGGNFARVFREVCG
jgi:membrane dipeptidase